MLALPCFSHARTRNTGTHRRCWPRRGELRGGGPHLAGVSSGKRQAIIITQMTYPQHRRGRAQVILGTVIYVAIDNLCFPTVRIPFRPPLHTCTCMRMTLNDP